MKLDDRIDVINKLLEEGSVQSLTYAALECRLTIEKICYEHLRVSYDYISINDFNEWRPKKVVDYVAAEANDLISNNIKLSISAPEKGGEVIFTGEQAGFSISKLSKLWQALSSLSLHVKLPECKQDDILIYSSVDKIREKVSSALREFENINKGNLILSSFFPEVSIECFDCGRLIKKKNIGNIEGKVVSCFNKDCSASYEISFDSDRVVFSKRMVPVLCEVCGNENNINKKLLEDLRVGQVLNMTCAKCAGITEIILQPCVVKKAKS